MRSSRSSSWLRTCDRTSSPSRSVRRASGPASRRCWRPRSPHGVATASRGLPDAGDYHRVRVPAAPRSRDASSPRWSSRSGDVAAACSWHCRLASKTEHRSVFDSPRGCGASPRAASAKLKPHRSPRAKPSVLDSPSLPSATWSKAGSSRPKANPSACDVGRTRSSRISAKRPPRVRGRPSSTAASRRRSTSPNDASRAAARRSIGCVPRRPKARTSGSRAVPTSGSASTRRCWNSVA